ncbi:hypothetical protein [Desulforhabdus amnigena]|uniref:hypothetical protein n=1 Tax=Desulforhabdus amnigena TaxID=40218 RepID=UPI002491F7F0|nr:hypothetical protein [Desulforhabdus amnigena]
MAHDNITFQERFPLSILACISLPFSFFVVTVPVKGVKKKLPPKESLAGVDLRLCHQSQKGLSIIY